MTRQEKLAALRIELDRLAAPAEIQRWNERICRARARRYEAKAVEWAALAEKREALAEVRRRNVLARIAELEVE